MFTTVTKTTETNT